MPSNNDKLAYSAGGDFDPAETPKDEGLVPSDASHLGSISVESINFESIGDPPKDKFVDYTQQEGGGGRGN